MEIHIWALVLLSAFMHASWNALIKTNTSRFVGIATQAGFVGVMSLALIPFFPLPSGHVWWIIIASGLVHVSYNMMLALAYQDGDFSYVYPIARGVCPIIITFVSVFVLEENVSSGEIIAIMLIVLGISSLVLRGGHKIIDSYKTTIIALLTGVLIASYSLIDGIGARQSGNHSSYLVWMFLVTAIFSIPFMIKGKKELITSAKENPIVIFKIFLGALLSLVGYWIVVWAMSQSPLAPISALREVSIIIAAIIGTLILKEGFGTTRILSSILVAAGVILMGAQYL